MVLLLRGQHDAYQCIITVTALYFEFAHNVKLQTHGMYTRSVSQLHTD